MLIRRSEEADCGRIAELFYETVHTVNAKDYGEEQLNAWADGRLDSAGLNESLSAHLTVVAVENGVLVGFGDMDDRGYLDRLYVDKDYLKRGVATAICDELEAAVGKNKFFTHASVTAKPFFEKRGSVS